MTMSTEMGCLYGGVKISLAQRFVCVTCPSGKEHPERLVLQLPEGDRRFEYVVQHLFTGRFAAQQQYVTGRLFPGKVAERVGQRVPIVAEPVRRFDRMRQLSQ